MPPKSSPPPAPVPHDLKARVLTALVHAPDGAAVRALLGPSGLLAQVPDHAPEKCELLGLVVARIGALNWAEYSSRDVVDWKRTRGAIEHENTLVNHRLIWLFTSQTVLLTLFGLVLAAKVKGEVKPEFQHYVPFVLGFTSGLAVVVCAVIADAIRGANAQLSRLEHWWHDTYRGQTAAHPPLQMFRRRFWSMTLSSEALPWWFMLFWAALVGGVVFDQVDRARALVADNPQESLLAVGAVLLLLMAGLAGRAVFLAGVARGAAQHRAAGVNPA